MEKVLYLIGSLRNPKIPELAKTLRAQLPEVEIFDDWYAAGPEADDFWKTYEQERGRSYEDALSGYAANHVFEFDKYHLDRASHVLLVLPAGKSGHMEVMYAEYATKAETAILLDPEDVRWDVMYQFIPTILRSADDIGRWLGRVVEPNGKDPLRHPQINPGYLSRGTQQNDKAASVTTYYGRPATPDDYARAALFPA